MKPGLFPKASVGIVAGLVATVFAPSALAQFNDQWLTLVEDLNRLKTSGGANADVINNGDEKDFAVADVNKDGWQDLAIGKKVQVSFPGPREGRFFLNDKGTLIDVTSPLMNQSLSGPDQGFKQALDTRDVEFGDVDGDGWLDMITCQSDLTNNTAAAAKRVTHPRVYINQGNDVNGNWLGMVHEDNRIPQLLTVGGINGSVRFCDFDIADVDNDGDLDMYFIDYDTDENGHGEPGNLDLNDRLLINNGSGFFTDQTASHFANTSMWSSEFGTEIQFVDFNNDGKIDFAKISTLTDNPNRHEALFNDISATTAPNFTGGYDVLTNIDTGENYTMANADINNDGRIDHLVGDDAVDHYRFNLSNSALGVNWSSATNYSWLSGSGDDGFPGQMYSRDYNNDGWNDCLITDVDLDLPGCNRRTKIYHNRGGTPGATNIILREEKQQSGSGGWFGAIGWSNNYPRGVNDAANIDIDNDGDIDIILGMCSGTDVWMNQTNPVVCQPTALPGSLGDMSLALCGQPLWSNLSSTLAITNGPPSGAAVLLVGLSATTAPAFGGLVLFPVIPSLAISLPLNGAGGISLPVPGGGGTPGGVTVFIQAIAGSPIEISNVLEVTVHD